MNSADIKITANDQEKSKDDFGSESNTHSSPGLHDHTGLKSLGEIDELLEMSEGVESEKDPVDFEKSRILKDDEARRDKDKRILQLWINQESSERKLRVGVVSGLGIILAGELIVGNMAFLKIGEGSMQFPEWTVQIFFMGMFTQIISMVFFVVKSLFPTPKTDSLSAIRGMVMNDYNQGPQETVAK